MSNFNIPYINMISEKRKHKYITLFNKQFYFTSKNQNSNKIMLLINKHKINNMKNRMESQGKVENEKKMKYK